MHFNHLHGSWHHGERPLFNVTRQELVARWCLGIKGIELKTAYCNLSYPDGCKSSVVLVVIDSIVLMRHWQKTRQILQCSCCELIEVIDLMDLTALCRSNPSVNFQQEIMPLIKPLHIQISLFTLPTAWQIITVNRHWKINRGEIFTW